VLGQLKDRTGSFGTGFLTCAGAVAVGFGALLYLGPVWRRQWSGESAVRAGLIKVKSAELQTGEQAA
jgi:hypothetical protein